MHMAKEEDGSICYKILTSRSYIVLDPNTQMFMFWVETQWDKLMRMKIFKKKYINVSGYNKIIGHKKPARQVEKAWKWD